MLHRIRSDRLDRFCWANGGSTSSLHTGPCIDPGSREQSCTEGTTFFRFEPFDRLIVDISLNLPPQRATSSTSAETDGLNGYPKLLEECEGVLEAERDAFEHCADEVTKGMRRGDTDKCGTCVGIEVWRALTEEIRRPQHSL